MLLNKEKLKENIDNRLNYDLSQCNVGDVSIIVNQNGETVYENYFGEAKKDTIFRLASMTKPVTGVAALIMLSRGKISLDDDVEKYLPAYKNMHIAKLDENKNIIDLGESKTKPKILHLLTHTSGIGTGATGEYYWNNIPAEKNRTLETAVDYFGGLGLEFEPFTVSFYSPLMGLDVMARIIELTSDMPFDEFVKKEITDPCEMYDTTFTPTEEQWDRTIRMHNKVDGKNEFISDYGRYKGFSSVEITHFLGGGGLFSTLHDYSNFAEMLLNKGNFNGKQIIVPEYIDLMATPHVPTSIMPGNQQWGLTVRVITDKSYGCLPVGAFGWSGAFGTHFWVDPVNNITAIYCKNSYYWGGAGSVTAKHFEEDVNASFN